MTVVGSLPYFCQIRYFSYTNVKRVSSGAHPHLAPHSVTTARSLLSRLSLTIRSWLNVVLNHAADRTDQMAARAAALEELEESGALDDVLAEGDEIDRELEKRSTEQRIERAEMRTRIGRETETETSVDIDGETTTP